MVKSVITKIWEEDPFREDEFAVCIVGLSNKEEANEFLNKFFPTPEAKQKWFLWMGTAIDIRKNEGRKEYIQSRVIGTSSSPTTWYRDISKNAWVLSSEQAFDGVLIKLSFPQYLVILKRPISQIIPQQNSQ